MPGQSPIENIAAQANAPLPAPDFRVPDSAADSAPYDVIQIPEGCPVQVLGHLKKTIYFLDFCGQLIEMTSKFEKGEIMLLFGGRGMAWLEKHFTQFKNIGGNSDKNPPNIVPDGFNQRQVQEAFIGAATMRGIFDPTGKVRGRGAHRGPNGEIILHCGDAVLIGGRKGTRGRPLKPAWHETGLIGDLVFPTAPKLARPDDTPAPKEVGQSILKLIETWNWKGGWIDAYLVFCWIATSPAGGALKWRPHLWINGPSGAGKTTLQDMIRKIEGDWAIKTEDSTEAGLRQLLNQDTIAVMFDEIEPDEHNAQVHGKIVKLARLASSGGDALRGGQDHKSQSFRAASCFLFSSIHHHELPAQDRNRMAIVDLAAFPPKAVMPVIPSTLGLWGDQLRRRMVEQWHRFDATLIAYQAEMLRQGYSGREQDTYGTLLACGDLMLYDDVPDRISLADEADRCERLVRGLARMLDTARAEAESTSERCIRYLTSHRLSASSGQHQESIGRWISRALVAILLKEQGGTAARDKLRTHGMKLVHCDKIEGESGCSDAYLPPDVKEVYLAVANKSNKAMLEIFDGSMWAGGVWTQSLAGITGAINHGKKVRYDGPPDRSVLIPIGEVVDVQAAREEAHRQATMGQN